VKTPNFRITSGKCWGNFTDDEVELFHLGLYSALRGAR